MAYDLHKYQDLPASSVDKAIWALEKKNRDLDEKWRRENIKLRSDLSELKNKFTKLLQSCADYLYTHDVSVFVEAVDRANPSPLKLKFNKAPPNHPEFHPERTLIENYPGQAIRLACPTCNAKRREKCIWE